MQDRGLVTIDGQMGEGGGQVLRSALALSALTGRPLHLVNLRGGRKRPGLMPQHLQAVIAAAEISGAEIQGAELGSRELVFTPRGLLAGDYRFDIGTAGSVTLVLQTIFLPLAAAGGASTVTITGGTHVPRSPAFHYLHLAWLPFLQCIGLDLTLSITRAGFYPRGGGHLFAVIHPAARLRPLRLLDRGRIVRIRCLSLAANLPLDIAARQSRQALARLSAYGAYLQSENAAMPALGKGTLLLLLVEFEHSLACYFSLGERGKPAEKVADEAADALLHFLASDGAVDEYMADQLLLPLAFAGGESSLRSSRLTLHLLTNAEVISRFTPATFEVEGAVGEPGTIRIKAVPLPLNEKGNSSCPRS